MHWINRVEHKWMVSYEGNNIIWEFLSCKHIWSKCTPWALKETEYIILLYIIYVIKKESYLCTGKYVKHHNAKGFCISCTSLQKSALKRKALGQAKMACSCIVHRHYIMMTSYMKNICAKLLHFLLILIVY